LPPSDQHQHNNRRHCRPLSSCARPRDVPQPLQPSPLPGGFLQPRECKRELSVLEPVISRGASATNSTSFACSVLLSTESNMSITRMGTKGDASAEKFCQATIHLGPLTELEAEDAEIERGGYRRNVGQSLVNRKGRGHCPRFRRPMVPDCCCWRRWSGLKSAWFGTGRRRQSLARFIGYAIHQASLCRSLLKGFSEMWGGLQNLPSVLLPRQYITFSSIQRVE
jgi:hypothetical protein